MLKLKFVCSSILKKLENFVPSAVRLPIGQPLMQVGTKQTFTSFTTKLTVNQQLINSSGLFLKRPVNQPEET